MHMRCKCHLFNLHKSQITGRRKQRNDCHLEKKMFDNGKVILDWSRTLVSVLRWFDCSTEFIGIKDTNAWRRLEYFVQHERVHFVADHSSDQRGDSREDAMVNSRDVALSWWARLTAWSVSFVVLSNRRYSVPCSVWTVCTNWCRSHNESIDEIDARARYGNVRKKTWMRGSSRHDENEGECSCRYE